MCDEMDLDELIALQEEEEARMQQEDEDMDLEVLRDWEQHKENKVKKALFQQDGGQSVGQNQDDNEQVIEDKILRIVASINLLFTN